MLGTVAAAAGETGAGAGGLTGRGAERDRVDDALLRAVGAGGRDRRAGRAPGAFGGDVIATGRPVARLTRSALLGLAAAMLMLTHRQRSRRIHSSAEGTAPGGAGAGGAPP